MSIHSYTGLPGHGKSYSVVEHVILPALKGGRHVVTNVALELELVRKAYPGCVLDEFPLEVIQAAPERLYEFALPGAVVVVDELWKLFPAGVKANQVPEPFKRWLAEHRHMVNEAGDSMQIVFVTQDNAQIAAFARNLIEQTFNTTKLQHLGFSKRFRVDVYDRGPTLSVMTPGKRRRQILGRFRSSVWKYYRSHTMSERAEGGANESSIDSRGLVWKSPLWWLGIPAAIAAGWWGLSNAVGFFGGGAAAPAHAAAAASQAAARELPVPPSAPAQPAPVVAAARPSVSYRLGGIVRSELDPRRGFAVIVAGDKALTVPLSSCWDAGDGLNRCEFNGYTVTELGAQ